MRTVARLYKMQQVRDRYKGCRFVQNADGFGLDVCMPSGETVGCILELDVPPFYMFLPEDMMDELRRDAYECD